MTWQKQRKQLLLTDDKNIFTYCFQSIQRLQPNSKAYDIRNSKCTKHNGDNPKSTQTRNDDVYNPILWIKHTKQQTKQTQPKQPKQQHQRGFHH